jgi:hypothetical protein
MFWQWRWWPLWMWWKFDFQYAYPLDRCHGRSAWWAFKWTYWHSARLWWEQRYMSRRDLQGVMADIIRRLSK